MKRIFVCEVFDDKALRALQEKKCNVLIAVKILARYDFAANGVELYPVLTFNEPGSWKAHHANQEALQALRSKFPRLFSWNDYDFFHAYSKFLLWININQSILEEAVNDALKTYNKASVTWHRTPPRISRLKNFILVALYFLRSLLPGRSAPAQILSHPKNPYVFCLSHSSVLIFWKYLLKSFNKNEVSICAFNTTDEIYRQIEEEVKKDDIDLCRMSAASGKWYPFFNIFSLKLRHVIALRHVIEQYSAFVSFADIADRTFTGNNRALILAGMENSQIGNLFCEVAHAKGIKVFNTMNGHKTCTANNAGVDFDKWFVWSERMKDMLETGCGVKPGIVYNTGLHLIQDKLAEHEFQGSLPIRPEIVNTRKIISIFTSPFLTPDEKAVIEYCMALVAASDEYYLIIRPHPRLSFKRIKEVIGSGDESKVSIIDVSKGEPRTTLYDQFCITHLSITFASTVALESKWFGIPTVTYEPTASSALYDVDNKLLFHASNINQLEELIREHCVMRGWAGDRLPFPGVGARYAALIRQMTAV